jgi:hypothetical protein
VRVKHSEEVTSGVHRIVWKDENEALPPVRDDVLRLVTEG